MKTGKRALRAVLFIGLTLPAFAGGCARLVAGANAEGFAEQQYKEGLREEARGNLGEAEDCYEDALDYDPAYTLALRRLGQMKIKFGDPDDAIQLFKRAVHLSGGDAGAFNDLGCGYEVAGDLEAAESAYRQGIKSDPDEPRLRTNLGLLLARQGRVNEALRQLRAAMSEEDAQHNLDVIVGKARHQRTQEVRGFETTSAR